MTDAEKAQLAAADEAAFRHVMNALFAVAGKLRGFRQEASLEIKVSAAGKVEFTARISEDVAPPTHPDLEPRISLSRHHTTMQEMAATGPDGICFARLCMESAAATLLRST